MEDKEDSIKSELDMEEQIDYENDSSTLRDNKNSAEMIKLQEEVDNLRQHVESLNDKLMRISAESENARKRYEKSAQEAKEYANVNFAKDLLSVLDNLARALEHKPIDLDSQTSSVLSGVEMTKDELLNIFKKHGLQAIEPQLGNKFDYNLHHAALQVMTSEHTEDSIVDVMQVGYKFRDRLIRPAMVKIAKKIS
ncbi:MAG: nucleotide exchange factor GrpE [Janthinobacterium lividum]